MTLKGLNGHYALCFKIRASFGAHHETLNEDRLYNEWRRCSPMTLDSDNIRFMRIFAGVPWKAGVIQQWGNRKRVFFEVRTLRIRHLRKWGQRCYIILFSPLSLFPLTPKCVTLNDFEWLEWPFYFMCSLLRTATASLFVAYLVPFVYHTWCEERRSAGSGI